MDGFREPYIEIFARHIIGLSEDGALRPPWIIT
jgi:hypothetical protein